MAEVTFQGCLKRCEGLALAASAVECPRVLTVPCQRHRRLCRPMRTPTLLCSWGSVLVGLGPAPSERMSAFPKRIHEAQAVHSCESHQHNNPSTILSLGACTAGLCRICTVSIICSIQEDDVFGV